MPLMEKVEPEETSVQIDVESMMKRKVHHQKKNLIHHQLNEIECEKIHLCEKSRFIYFDDSFE